jgi:lysophospholipase L1-like esterase
MEQILVYADSLSWGIIPNTRQRLPYEARWPGVLDQALITAGKQVRLIENCLNGRRTVWSDPFKAGRDGSDHLAQVIEMHSPLRLVILMLGTNDFQNTHDNNAWLSAQGTATLIKLIQTAPIEPGMPSPSILVIAPPQIIEPRGEIAAKFDGAAERCKGLNQALKAVCEQLNADYFDSNLVISASQVDGIHLDAVQHDTLGKAVAAHLLQHNHLD